MFSRNRQQYQAEDDFDVLFRLFSLIISGREEHDVLSLNLSGRKKRFNLLLLGKTGHGKSATGNSTLGRREFESKASASSVTSEVKCGQVELENYMVNVIDSPGLADTNYDEDKLQEIQVAIANMKKAVTMFPEGIHAFLFVVKFGNRFTNEEKSTVCYLKKMLGHEFLKERGIIVFTHGDAFEQAMEEEDTPDKDFDEWCYEQTGAMGELIEECGYRCVLFNNRLKDKHKQQKQMENVIELAETFDEPYSYIDFCMFQNQREQLILEQKVPLLKKDFQRQIDNLDSSIKSTCEGGSTTSFEFILLYQRIQDLKTEINAADKNTGLLDDMKMKVSLSEQQVDKHRRNQAEARRLREENESSCCIL